jgi:hypothetical protein
MPRIEFENIKQKYGFLEWLGEKVGEEKAHRLEFTQGGDPEHATREIWMVDNDPLVVRDWLTKSDGEDMTEALVSRRHANELKKAGIIFENESVRKKNYAVAEFIRRARDWEGKRKDLLEGYPTLKEFLKKS